MLRRAVRMFGPRIDNRMVNVGYQRLHSRYLDPGHPQAVRRRHLA